MSRSFPESRDAARHRSRVVACGSEGVGKSTLIARMLQEANARVRGPGAERSRLDLAEIGAGDGESAGVASSAGADAAIVVADVRHGLDSGLRRALRLADLLGARRVALVANKLDAVDFSREAFEALAAEVRAFAGAIGAGAIEYIPASARTGDNLASSSERLAWYAGLSLLEWLEQAPAGGDRAAQPGTKPPEIADQFEVTLAWLAQDPLLPGRRYRIRVGAEILGATFVQLKYVVGPDTLDHLAARTLTQGAIGVGTLLFDAPIAFDAGGVGAAGGSFAVLDRSETSTIGVGRLHFALRRSHNLAWQATDVDRAARTARNGHRPCVVWFTGLSGAGKSTIANLVEKALHVRGCHTYLLDGDNVRHGLNRDLGFTDADRVENVRRVAEVARLMADAGLIVLVSFISPFRAERRMARALVGAGEFCEVFVDAPLAVAEARDVKGLYAKARRGELPHFTGIDSPYEPPERPDVHVDSATEPAAAAATRIVDYLRGTHILD
ncbi:MAG TPA: adenylyl-sulfate kinase [Casimicrobiaceae bacterium]